MSINKWRGSSWLSICHNNPNGISDEAMTEPSSINNNEVNIHVDAVKMSQDLLSEHLGCKIEDKFVLKLVKETKNVSKEVKEACKILEFSSEWKFDEILTAIDELNLQEFPNLFVVIIRCQNLQLKTDQLKDKLPKKERKKIRSKIKNILRKVNEKFTNPQNLILQITSIDENETKFYYKEGSSDLIDGDEQVEAQNSFSTFLSDFLDGKFENFGQLAAAWKQNSNSKLTLKVLKLFDDLFFKLILEVTKNGTKADLLKILEAPAENEGRMLSFEAQSYLSEVLFDKQPDNKPVSDSNDSTAEPEDNSENKPEDQKSSSVLLTAIEHKKTEIIDFLITYWTHLIQQLPAIHRLQISTTAFNTKQLDVLCDLLDIADFPFPEKFDPETEHEHLRLYKLTISRLALSEAIRKENYEKIDKFIDSHSSLKYVYSIDNYLALSQAIEFKKFGVFYYLKSLGFEGEDCEEILSELKEDEKNKAIQQAVNQRKANVKEGSISSNKSVMMLAMRSIIHNRKTSKEREEEYRQKIINWFEDIHKVAPEMLDVAASCERLKIIFDFESNTVENVSLAGPNSLGSTYPVSKWIFIGAKLSDKLREQKIKGVLAHELCHYVMRLVYENQENPYFKDREDVKEMFEAITKEIDQWSAEDAERPDDECGGIISTVFTLYSPDEFHLELIVRVVHILTQFDDNKDKTNQLQRKYQNLFDFWHQQVVPDLRTFLQKNPEVIKLNRSMELLQKIQQLKNLEFVKGNDLNELTKNKLAIATTNVPKLFLLEITKNFESKDGKLMDSRSLFIDPEKLKSDHILDDYRYMCNQVQELTVFVDFSKRFSSELINQIFRPFINFIFVVSNEEQSKKLKEILLKKDKNVKELKINYEWNDLTEKSQKFLLENKKINFQNNSQMSMMEFFDIKSDNLSDLSEVINAELLNKLMNDEKISINFQKELNFNENLFKFLNIEREFLKKAKTEIENDNESKPVEISQKSLLYEVKNNKFVLISDMAGNGKSWAMKNFSKIISKENPKSWVAYVDLKQFIKYFKEQAAQQVMPEFSTFMAEKILNPKQEFEAKIFKKLYKDGKVFIFLDGFDEIAPDCAEFVSNLAQSFKQNGGNQLWIATRDYFEINLRTKLRVDVAYGLDEMNDWQGIKMIAKSWILMDLGEKIKSMSLQEFNQYVEDSSDYEKYKEKAKKIVEKVKTDWRSIGMPQMFKMIADVFKNEQNLENLSRSEIYDKYIDSQYSRWINETGEIRSEENVKSQRQQFNFWTFHQFHAIASELPKLAEILFPGYDGKDLRAEHVVGCGIVSIKNGKIYFNHETLREFFIAKVLAEALKNEEINEKVVEVFVDVLTLPKYRIIRMFLNDIIEPKDSLKTQLKMKKFVEKFNNFEIFEAYFEENLENLVNFYFLILKNGDHGEVKSILEESSSDIASKYAKSSTIFSKFQDFLFEFLNSEDLKNLIKNQKILENIIKNKNLGFDVFNEFVLIIESNFGFDFAQEELKRAISDSWLINTGEYFSHNFIFNVKDQKAEKFAKFMKMLQKFLSPEEVLKFLKKTDDYGRNILFKFIGEEEMEFLEVLWTENENYFASQNKSQEFKKFVKQQCRWEENILHKVAECKNLEIHEVLWKLLLNTFEDREQLKDFVLQKNEYGINFIHWLVLENKNPKIIEFTLKNLKQNLNNLQFQEILQSRGDGNRSLLHSTALGGHNIEVFKLLWQEFRSSCKSDQEFWQILKEINEDGCNILTYAAWRSPIEVFIFLIDEFEKNYSKEEIEKMLSNSDKEIQNLLHNALWNESEDVFKAVWKKFHEYLTKEEILEIAKQVSYYEENFLFFVKSGETFEFAIEELEKIATNDEIKIMLNRINKEKRNILQDAAYLPEKSLNFHESLWKILKKYFEKSEILNLIKNVDKNGNNVLHIAVSSWKPIEVVEFTWNEIKSFLSHEQQIEYLMLKGGNGKNLIKLCENDKNKLWIEKLFREYQINF